MIVNVSNLAVNLYCSFCVVAFCLAITNLRGIITASDHLVVKTDLFSFVLDSDHLDLFSIVSSKAQKVDVMSQDE